MDVARLFFKPGKFKVDSVNKSLSARNDKRS